MNKKFINEESISRSEVEELLKQFRSDMFSRFDQIVGELAQGREDKLFMDHDIKQLKQTDAEHEKRIKELETQIKN